MSIDHMAVLAGRLYAVEKDLDAARATIAEMQRAARDVLKDEEDAPDGATVAEISIGKLNKLRAVVEGR